MERPIFLTVGGRPFTVLASTLTLNSTYFKNVEDKLDGAFIPRDGELFDHCLRFLYGNREFISELSLLTQWSLWREAEFYQMTELCETLQALLRPQPSDEDKDSWKIQGDMARGLLLTVWPHVKRLYEDLIPALEPIGHVLFEHVHNQESWGKLWHYLMSSSGRKNRRRPEDSFQNLKAEKDDPDAMEGARVMRTLMNRIGLALVVAMFAQRVEPPVDPAAAPPPPPAPPAPPAPQDVDEESTLR